jgi:hypothetical protein
MKREQVDFGMSSNIKFDFSQILTSKLPESLKAPVGPVGCANRIRVCREAGEPAHLKAGQDQGALPSLVTARKPGHQPIKTDGGKGPPLKF